ncbi:MAG TPA: hypothetical protein VF815_39760 [Myxococcaceae bacterium]|jgi:hypothetical protein
MLGLVVGPAWSETRSNVEMGFYGGLLVTQNDDWAGATAGLYGMWPLSRHVSLGGELVGLSQDYEKDRFMGVRFGFPLRWTLSTGPTRPYVLGVLFVESPGETALGGGAGLGYLSELGSDRILLDLQVRGMSRFSTLFPQLTLSATLGVAAVF